MLTLKARIVIAASVVAGAITATAAVVVGTRTGIGPVASVVLLASLAAATWIWPLLIYRGTESEAVHLDEGLFVVMAVVLPPAGTVLAFAAATVVSQVVRRRPFVKSVFNFGQVLTAVGVALLTVEVLSPASTAIQPATVAAAAAGAVAFFVVNTAAIAAILAVSGTATLRATVRDGAEIRILLVGACISLGAVTAMAAAAYTWGLALIGLPFLIVRQALAGHFEARHDRYRMEGLFQATLESNESMGVREVEDAVCRWATRLLRANDAQILDVREDDGPSTEIETARGTRWLTVRGRSKSEPFVAADGRLLEALAAVGSGALRNASLYEAMNRQQARLATITSALGEGVAAVDATGQLTFVNPAAQAMLGLTDESGGVCLDFIAAPAERAMAARSTLRLDDATFRHADGAAFPVACTCSPIFEDGQPTGAVVVFRDTSERKAFEQRLAHHAFHDSLTGLPNRRVFLDRLEHALGRSRRTPMTHAVLFCDVDRFKLVNDNVGHVGGDHLLIAIGARLAGSLRPGDTLARFGGDEFTILLEDVADAEAVEAGAARIMATLNAPIALPSGHDVVASLSVGIAISDGRSTADDLLHNADVAMYQAKSRGPGQYQVFDAAEMTVRSLDRVEMEAALRRAIEGDDIEVYYQPVATVDGDLVGAEALVRWRHPERGLIGPAEFIGLAEETGLMIGLGTTVLDTACRDAQRWHAESGRPLSVSVNLSARQFAQQDLTAQVARALGTAGLDPSSLCLEITESVAVLDLDRTTATLHDLKRLGVQLAIDDFGTGYSSLNYLKQFPVDVVKLDRAFVAGLEESVVDTAIISAVVGLAAAIGMSIVAEGVETEGQLAQLRSLGCPLVQGFLMARPMPGGEFETLLGELPPGLLSSPPKEDLLIA